MGLRLVCETGETADRTVDLDIISILAQKKVES